MGGEIESVEGATMGGEPRTSAAVSRDSSESRIEREITTVVGDSLYAQGFDEGDSIPVQEGLNSADLESVKESESAHSVEDVEVDVNVEINKKSSNDAYAVFVNDVFEVAKPDGGKEPGGGKDAGIFKAIDNKFRTFSEPDEEPEHEAKPAPPSVEPTTTFQPNPRYKANFLSRMLFWYMNSLVKLGYKRPLEMSDMWEVDPAIEGKIMNENFNAR
eukprot:40335-Pyramimonas_sp.AAC.1